MQRCLRRYETFAAPLSAPNTRSRSRALIGTRPAQDLVVRKYVRPNGDRADPDTVSAALEQVPPNTDVLSSARVGAFGQALASGKIMPGDRIVAVGGKSTLGGTPAEGLNALKALFVAAKTEEVGTLSYQ